MTATAMLPRLTAYGFDTDRTADWRERAACRDQWHDFEALLPKNPDQLVGSRVAKAAHRCLQHCAVLLQCTLLAERPGKRPFEIVQAGKYWSGNTSRPPRTLPDPGHGDHCAHLRRQR